MQQLYNRFFQAITLCTGDSSIKSRLAQAWIEQLDDISSDELPHLVRKDFEQLRSAMYAEKPLTTEHTAQASVRKMSARQAAVHTATIVRVFQELLTINNSSQKIPHKQGLSSKIEVGYEQDNSQHLN